MFRRSDCGCSEIQSNLRVTSLPIATILFVCRIHQAAAAVTYLSEHFVSSIFICCWAFSVAGAMSGGGIMKPLAVYGQEVAVEDLVLHSAMEVDMDGDSLDRLTDAAQLLDHKPTDADFFDAFEDDFDDADLV